MCLVNLADLTRLEVLVPGFAEHTSLRFTSHHHVTDRLEWLGSVLGHEGSSIVHSLDILRAVRMRRSLKSLSPAQSLVNSYHRKKVTYLQCSP